MKEKGGPIDSQQGVSCIIVNSTQGQELINKVSDDLYLFDSNIDDIAKRNHQLNHPSPMPKQRNAILQAYENGGYTAFAKAVAKAYKWQRRKAYIKTKIKKILCLR